MHQSNLQGNSLLCTALVKCKRCRWPCICLVTLYLCSLQDLLHLRVQGQTEVYAFPLKDGRLNVNHAAATLSVSPLLIQRGEGRVFVAPSVREDGYTESRFVANEERTALVVKACMAKTAGALGLRLLSLLHGAGEACKPSHGVREWSQVCSKVQQG